MSHRYLVPVAMLAAAVVVLVSISGSTHAQTKGAADSWTPPRTPWGDPDLQGVWNNATITPLERPEQFAGREFLSNQEAAALEHQAAESSIDRPPKPGDTGFYNLHWLDGGTKVVRTRRSSLIVDPPDGRIPWKAGRPTVRTNAKPGEAFLSWMDLDTGERCLTDGLPFLPYTYNNNYLIVQTPGYLTILHEQYSEIRIIPLNGQPHVNQNVKQWFGDSRGHWQGTTLVVETTNFNDRTYYRWQYLWRANRPTTRLIERFMRTDASTLEYQFTIEDPTTYSRAWTAVSLWTTDQQAVGATAGQLFEYACHEGNRTISNVLSGARAQERGR